MIAPALVKYQNLLWATLAESDQFGIKMWTLAGLPRRAFTDDELRSTSPLVQLLVDPLLTEHIPTMSSLLRSKFDSEDSWLASTRKAQNTLLAWFLLTQDPQRRLIVEDISPLRHQRSLVEHVLSEPGLTRVLIGDEVGLGKTVEAGLITQRLLASQPDLRVLYLAPARLVENVASEFRRLGIDARTWISGNNGDARLGTDRVVIASIQKAVYEPNVKQLIAAAPWDLIIADECHHLSAWAQGAGSANAGYRLVRKLIDSQRTGRGRLLLLSGTPHQGNQVRFENLLELLRLKHETLGDVAGRVIYRTKESVRDWQGRPLFPKRDVRPPRLARLGDEWMEWYRRVGDLYNHKASVDSGRSRAGGWAKGQALQWAASSVEAGLGFLVRLAIRRLQWTTSEQSLAIALKALRPYRGGAINEPIASLYVRLEKQIGTIESQEDAEELEDTDADWKPNGELLAELLLRGTELKEINADGEKWRVMADLLREANGEKVVLFCQPVETVGVVAQKLEQEFGVRPSVIIGGQSESERSLEIERFRAPGGPQFIVSSRAGGEGLNLQVSRRLVHLDIPWNPMDLEQRVGRVHRFGSRQTILVDSIVVPGTREADAYRIARSKLSIIAGQLDPERFELLFSRVMNLVPPEELAAIFGAEQTSPPGVETENRIADIVHAGFEKLNCFESEYSEGARRLRELEPGQADWPNFRDYLKRVCSAEHDVPGMKPIFSLEADDVVSSEASVETMRVFDKRFVCDETDGLPCHDGDGRPIPRLGMESKLVLTRLRERLEDVRESAIGAVKIDTKLLGKMGDRKPLLVTFAALQRLSFAGGIPEERNLDLVAYAMDDSGEHVQVSKEHLAAVVQAVYDAERQTHPTVASTLLDSFAEALPPLMNRIREDARVNDPAPVAVWPTACFVLVSP